MSLIVDTSVWSLALRRGVIPDDPQVKKLELAIRQGQSIQLLGIIVQEILQGIKSSTTFLRVKTDLDLFTMLQLERDDYIAAAELGNLCRSKGVQASTTDFQIAAACIRHDCSLLTNDKDFRYIAQHCPLQLL